MRIAKPVLFTASVALAIPSLVAAPQNRRCAQYARSAVEDYQVMIKHKECRVPDSGRWNANYQGPYDWCMQAPEAARIIGEPSLDELRNTLLEVYRGSTDDPSASISKKRGNSALPIHL
jgi:hypothetical protein